MNKRTETIAAEMTEMSGNSATQQQQQQPVKTLAQIHKRS